MSITLTIICVVLLVLAQTFIVAGLILAVFDALSEANDFKVAGPVLFALSFACVISWVLITIGTALGK